MANSTGQNISKYNAAAIHPIDPENSADDQRCSSDKSVILFSPVIKRGNGAMASCQLKQTRFPLDGFPMKKPPFLDGFPMNKSPFKTQSIAMFGYYIPGWWFQHPSEKYESQLG